MRTAAAVPALHCSGCGRSMTKVHRKHNGERFCASCYARLFKRRLCSSCGGFARLPSGEGSICRKCESARPCVRCGASGRNVGMMTRYGPVCNACRPHFVDPKPCGECGKPSNRLSRVSRLGLDVQVCPICARRDFATCQSCRRHRLLAETRDGRLLCSPCISIGAVSCRDCGVQMPAGRGIRCESCYWRGLHSKRVQLDQAAFATPQFASLFAEYAAWLQGRIGWQRAALRIHRYLPFFIEIEQRWRDVPSYSVLLAHFGAEGLRHVRLPMTWFTETQCMEVNAVAREADSENRRIRALLGTMPVGTVGALVLTAYRDRLQAKVDAGKSSIRSMRLALRPAASLLIVSDSSGNTLPDQASVDRLLRKAPGQLAALSGFIRYLNKHYALGLVPVADEQEAALRRRRGLEVKLLAMARSSNGDDRFRREWIGIGLKYFHGLPAMLSRQVREDAVVIDSDGYRVSINGQEYWLPTPEHIVGT